eukprot:gene26440-57458_t
MTDCVSNPPAFGTLSGGAVGGAAAHGTEQAWQWCSQRAPYEEAKRQTIGGRNVAKDLFQIWTAADEGTMTARGRGSAAQQAAQRVLNPDRPRKCRGTP